MSNNTTDLKLAFERILYVGDWSPKILIKDAAQDVMNAMEEWKYANGSLYYDAKNLAETKVNTLSDLVGQADRLKISLYNFIKYLDEDESEE